MCHCTTFKQCWQYFSKNFVILTEYQDILLMKLTVFLAKKSTLPLFATISLLVCILGVYKTPFFDFLQAIHATPRGKFL